MVGVAVVRTAAAGAAATGIENRQFEEAIAIAVPTPVDVVETIAVIAVADEGMPTSGIGTVVYHRTLVLDLVVNKIVPPLCRVVGPLDITGVHIVVEITAQGFGEFVDVGRRGVGAIVRLHGLAAVAHELGHGLALRRRLSLVIAVEHVVP